MKKSIYLFTCILISLFLIQFSSAVADWDDFGFDTRTTQAQSSTFSSQFGEAPRLTTSMANGLSTNNANIPYQPLVPEIDTNGNYLVLSNGNYLQVYNKNLVLVTEKLTGTPEGQLSTLNFIGSFDNIEEIVGLWKPNATTLSFRIYNFTGNLSLISESNFTNSLNMTTNGVKCFTALGYGECYAFIDEIYNSTIYQHSFLKITYNPIINATANFTKYILTNSSNKTYEPPAWIDWDFDGTLEFLGFSQDRVLVVDYNGNLELNYSIDSLENAKFIRTDAGNYKIILVNQENYILGGSYNRIRYRVLKTDGTILWEVLVSSFNSGNLLRNNGLAIADYDGDGYEDIWVLNSQTGSTDDTKFAIYKGSNGNILFNLHVPPDFSGVSYYGNYQMTLARMTPNSAFDIIGSRNGYAYLFIKNNDTWLFSNNIGSVSCIPVDLTYDGLTDIICTYPSGTTKYSVNYTNQNAYINSVEFSPATTIQVNSTLTATISATDPESDYIYYSIRCNNTASFSTDTGSNVKYCTYDTLGMYNVTTRVRDEFHGTYDTLTQEIEVAITTYTQVEGGVSIPTQLVDVDNTNEGLLPSIYYGTLGFFSNILSPLFIIVVLFLSVAIIITIIAIAVKLVKKASSIG